MAFAPYPITDHVIHSLQFPEIQKTCAPFTDDEPCNVFLGESTSSALSQCLLCQQNFELAKNSDKFHQHLHQEHQLIIQDPHLICDLKKYTEYWRTRFSQENYKSLCNNRHEEDKFYRLDPSMSEDHQIREYLQRKRLDAVLKVQQSERDDTTLSRSCLFCREFFEGNRAELFNHMAFGHNFNIGQPDNIVFANEFLDILESKMESLQCLYCEKTFRDKTALKDHMRKKQHRRLNPNNKTYDKFYVINYLEAGKDWQEVQAERDVVISSPDSDNEEGWDDWDEDYHTNLVCLYCKHSTSMVPDIMDHMKQMHSFDLCRIRDELALNFYEQIKLVNFVRRCVHQAVCVYCDKKCETREGLSEHLMSHSSDMESGLERSKWDQPQFLFPTYENDALLCSLEDVSDEENEESAASPQPQHLTSNVPILAEDQPVSENCILFKDKDMLQTLVSGR